MLCSYLMEVTVLLQPGSGMWIDSSHDIKGTYALAGHLFWDSWLLPLLQDFNRQTEFYTQTPDVKVANDTATVYFYWSIGQNPQPDSYFAYQKGMLSVLDKSLGYHWGSTDYDVNNNDQQGSNPPHGTFRAVAEQTGEFRINQPSFK